ncbi:MAG: hypothetical protein ABIP48_00930 [Planctomycetota bacterium]
MADADKKAVDNAKKLKLRTAINDAYAFVLSQELNAGIGAIDFDTLLQQELAHLKEGSISGRMSRKEELKALETRVHDAIAEIKKLEPGAFSSQGDEEAVNTEED